MRFTAFLAACSVLALAAGSAKAAEWRLVEVSGTVRIAVPGAEAAPARLNQAVPTGSSVTTTLGARAALDNGLQHIVVGPNSRMTVAPDAGGFTRVMQDLGAVMFKVDKQKAPHFRVDTPLLAAIVKGTTFTVVVGPQADSVNVAEGLVEVRSNATDMASDVPAGSSGAVSRDAPQAVQVAGTVTPTSGEPVAMKIEPLDYKAISGGLVDSGAPAMMSSEVAALASGAVSETTATGVEIASAAAPPAVMAADAARDERSTRAESLGADPPGPTADAGPRNGNGGGPKDPGPSGSNGNGNGPGGPGGGKDGGPKDPGPAGPNGNGNGPDGPGGGKDGGPKDPGPAGPNGNGNGPDGPGGGKDGGPKDPGPAGPNGNGNGPAGPGGGKDGGPKDPGPAGPNGNGNGPEGPGGGKDGGPKDPGPAGPNGNGNGPEGPGNGNGGGPKDPGPAGPNGNGNGPEGPANGNGGGPPEAHQPGPNGNGGGLVGDLLTTVGGVTDGLIGPGKGRGPK